MKTSEAIDKLMPAWHAARKAMTPAGKGGVNRFDKYSYATEYDWHAAIMPELVNNGLVLSFSVDCVDPLGDRPTKSGGVEYSYQVRLTARLIHTSGQWVEVMAFGHGQDRSDKGVYKAITGAKKYGYATLFALPTTDDPEEDNRRPEQEQASGHHAPPDKSEQFKAFYFAAKAKCGTDDDTVAELDKAIASGKWWKSREEMKSSTDVKKFEAALAAIEFEVTTLKEAATVF